MVRSQILTMWRELLSEKAGFLEILGPNKSSHDENGVPRSHSGLGYFQINTLPLSHDNTGELLAERNLNKRASKCQVWQIQEKLLVEDGSVTRLTDTPREGGEQLSQNHTLRSR